MTGVQCKTSGLLFETWHHRDTLQETSCQKNSCFLSVQRTPGALVVDDAALFNTAICAEKAKNRK